MRLCQQCSKTATFGIKGSNPTACKDHKQAGMTDLRHSTCQLCDRRPSFANYARQPATHCKLHKTGTMVNVKHTLCEICETYASYGFLKNRPIRCYEHQIENMRNVKATICQAPNCTNAKPKYGNGVVGRAYCELHHNHQEHWNVTTCCSPLCSNIATHSKESVIPFVYCFHHAPPSFTTAFIHICTSCTSDMPTLCDVQGSCYRRCYTKQSTEKELKDFFITKHLTFVYNRCAPKSNKRPDFLFQTAYGHVIVENDEHKHSDHSFETEKKRMLDIHKAFQTHVHFIRFNPDLTSKHVESLSFRHEILYENIAHILANPELFFTQNQGLSMRYLFY